MAQLAKALGVKSDDLEWVPGGSYSPKLTSNSHLCLHTYTHKINK